MHVGSGEFAFTPHQLSDQSLSDEPGSMPPSWLNRKSADARVTGFCPYALDRPSTVLNQTRLFCGYSRSNALSPTGMLNVLPTTSSAPGWVADTPSQDRAI